MAYGDYVLELKKAVEAQELVERTECPECFYPLDKMEDGTLHCKWCGWASELDLSWRNRLSE